MGKVIQLFPKMLEDVSLRSWNREKKIEAQKLSKGQMKTLKGNHGRLFKRLRKEMK